MTTKKQETSKVSDVTVSHCQIGCVTPETLEAVSKLADVLMSNADAVKVLAASIKTSPIETAIRIG